MKRVQWISLAALLLLGLAVGYLTFRNRQPPILPDDEEHGRTADLALCMTCHGPDQILPQSPNHPLGNDCLRCHGSR